MKTFTFIPISANFFKFVAIIAALISISSAWTPVLAQSLSVTPSTATVVLNGNQQFTALFTSPTSGTPTDVTSSAAWTVSPAGTGTTISGGLLHIGAAETATALTVTASYTPLGAGTLTASATVTVNFPPEFPSSASITVTNIGINSAYLEWTQANDDITPSGQLIYKVKWGESSSSTLSNSSGSISAETYRIDYLDPDTEYDVAIYAYDDAGNESQPINTSFRTLKPATITGVAIDPAIITLAQGATQQFTATVNGEGSFSTDVKWDYRFGFGGNNNYNWIGGWPDSNILESQYGTISVSGLLKLGTGNPFTHYEVRATSLQDPSKYAVASITISNPSIITGVSVTPAGPVTVNKGEVEYFYATILGTNNPYQEMVEWFISTDNYTWYEVNNAIDGIIINTYGKLTVSNTTKATKVYVKARHANFTSNGSVMDLTYYSDVVPVTIADKTSITISPGAVSMNYGETKQFTATVTGGSEASPEIKWDIRLKSGVEYVSAWVTSSMGASISNAGELILENYRAPYSHIEVRASLAQDPSVYAIAQVTIINPASITQASIVSPANLTTVVKGSSLECIGQIIGTNYPVQQVTWQISADKVLWMADVDGVSIRLIDATKAKLSVSYGTSLSTIYVRACPVMGDPLGEKVSEPVEIRIIDAPPATITGVTISPTTATMTNNESQQFTATVSGTGDFSQEVCWHLRARYNDDSWTNWTSGICDGYGYINVNFYSGLLSIIGSPILFKQIEVVVSSMQDPTKYAVATVNFTNSITSTDIIISPSENVSVKRGDTLQFSGTVADMSISVSGFYKWSISTDQSNWLEYLDDGSSISSTGLLTVSTTTKAPAIYVRAKAYIGGGAYSNTVKVNITNPFPSTTVTGVKVTPASVTLKQGERQRFAATVSGTGGIKVISQAVTWEVRARLSPKLGWSRWTVDGTDLGASINSSGVLLILPGCRFPEIEVRAISVQNPLVYGTASVTVSNPGSIKDISQITTASGKIIVDVNKGETLPLNVTTTGTNDAKASIKWYITPGMPLQETSTRSVSLRRADTGSDIIWTKSFEKISIDDNGLLTIDPSTVVEEVYVRAEDEYDMNVNTVIKIVVLEYYNANSNHVIEVRLPLVYAAGSDIYIDLPDAARVDIYRIDGVLVRSVNAPEGKSVVASSLPRGIYVVRSGIATSKLIIR